MLRFVLLTVVLAAVIFGGVVYGVSLGYFPEPTFLKEIVIFLGISNIAIYSLSKRSVTGAPTDFVKLYLGATVLRIVFFGAFIFVIMRLDPSSAFANTALFLAAYFMFTALEVVILFHEINSQKVQKRVQKDQ